MRTPLLASVVALTLGAVSIFAADPAAKAPAAPKASDPEFRKYPLPVEPDENVSYGPHRMQRIYFWRAKSDKPTPLLFYIHGGGWSGGDRSVVRSMIQPALEAGISVVSVEYRTIKDSTADGLVPPVKGPMFDCARALQFTRSKAKEWNLDKTKVALAGGSAGACTSLWLAFHDDLADPQSADPIARESTRLTCAAVTGPQTTLDPTQMKEWTPNSNYGGHAFGFKTFEEFLAGRGTILPLIAEYSPYALVSSDDPAVYMTFGGPPAIGQNEKDPTHTANFGAKLAEHCATKGVSAELHYRGLANPKHATPTDFLLAKLKAIK